MAFMKRRTYLDWAAAAPVSAGALLAFSRAVAASGNPSSPHAEGRAAREIFEDARTRTARLAGVKPEAVIFTSGATEANAIAIEGHVRARIAAGTTARDLHALYLPSAHTSVIGAMRRIEALGVATGPISVTDGTIDLSALAKQIRPETALVAVDVVCGETGSKYPVRDIRRTLDRVRPDGPRIMLMADASQAPRVESFELQHLGADMVTLDAQKVGGVRGIGCLIAPRAALASLVEGGGQERGLRPGTESPSLAAAFATALEECEAHRDVFVQTANELRAILVESCTQLRDCVVNEGKRQAPHILNLSLLGRDTDYLLALLDEAGFAVSTKSACETDKEGSRAVYALYGDAERARTTLRISWGPQARASDLRRFADAFARAVRFMDENAI